MYTMEELARIAIELRKMIDTLPFVNTLFRAFFSSLLHPQFVYHALRDVEDHSISSSTDPRSSESRIHANL